MIYENINIEKALKDFLLTFESRRSIFEFMIFKQSILFVILALSLVGCASNQVYDPIAASLRQKFLLNESSIAQVRAGMTQEQVHKMMGDSLVIGFNKEEPLTINNPYKTEQLIKGQKTYTIEYYIFVINRADGIVTDDELIPFVFDQGKLLGKGKDFLKTLQ